MEGKAGECKAMRETEVKRWTKLALLRDREAPEWRIVSCAPGQVSLATSKHELSALSEGCGKARLTFFAIEASQENVALFCDP